MLCIGISASAAELADISNYEFEKEIVTLQALGIVEGDETGNFNPMEPVTRAEAAKLLMTAFSYDGIEYPQTETEFSDVSADHWASGYIQAATEIGYIAGMGDGTYMPDAEITFEQACTLIVRALGYDLFAENYGGYPTGHMIYANDLDLIDEIDLSNEDVLTRGELAYMLAQAMEAPTVEVVYGFMLSIMQGNGVNYVCPMSKYHNAYWVNGTITATPRSSQAVQSGWVDIEVIYARRLGDEYINNTPTTFRCRTVDGDDAVNELLLMRGDFILKETDEGEYTVIMIVV